MTPEEYVSMPWKNGGGTTRELMVQLDQAGQWLWRISVADVRSSGPFSIFPNYDRSLSLLSGKGMKLGKATGDVIINKNFQPITFLGEENIYAELIEGEITDFNVFWKRDHFIVEVSYLDKRQSNSLLLQCKKNDSFFVFDLDSHYSHLITPEYENDSTMIKFNAPLLLVKIIDISGH